MAAVTAKMVGELRQMTGQGMMECKKALVEAEGDMKKAEEILRVKSGNKAQKLAGRQAAEGVIAVCVEGKAGALVEINCETDFVAKDESFKAFADKAARAVLQNRPKDVQAAMGLSVDGGTLEEARQALIARLRENISLRRFEVLDGAPKIDSYMHNSSIGVLVAYEGAESAAHDAAMQVAAMRPRFLNEAAVDAETIETERRVAEEKMKKEEEEKGKKASEEIAKKRIEGSVRKFIKESTLMGQAFVKDEKKSVAQYLKESGTTVKAYAVLKVGEGIERKEVDYAAEVAAAAKI